VTLDEQWLLAVNHGLAHPVSDFLFVWVSDNWTFSIPLLGLILADAVRRAGRRGLRLWLLLVAGVIVGDQMAGVLKDVVAEPRPCYSFHEPLRDTGGGPLGQCSGAAKGSPSAHALNFTFAATFLLITTPWRHWHWLLHLGVVLVCLSRVYLGKHFPSQVAEGYLVGLGLGMLAGGLACYYRLCLPGAAGSRQPRHEP
jgi:undecaprenyl-diphosphatase